MRKISYITPDDPEYHVLKNQNNVVVVNPEQIGEIIPQVLININKRNRRKKVYANQKRK